MTGAQIIVLAMPVFLLAMAAEFAIGVARRRNTYRLNDTLGSLGLGVMSQVFDAFGTLFKVAMYTWVFQHVALFELPAASPWVWLGALLGYDLCYYGLHRAGHRVGVLWAAHVVHHQSEDYNLGTALRQTSSGLLLGWIFYLPLALAGVPPLVFGTVALIDLLYQFWVHTEQIGKLGWFDRVFCSPSNHRAHHATNDRYLDHNYGGILILWDRLFGTFVEEDDVDRPVYGTRSPLRSWNPLWANAEVYWAAAVDAWRAKRWRDKAQIWFRRPGWRPADVAARFPKPEYDLRRERYDPPIPPALAVYCLLQFAMLLGMATHFLGLTAHAGLGTLVGYAFYMVASLCIIGALMESRRTAFWLEGARTLLTAVVPPLLGRWFGVAHLDTYATAAFGVVFGASALVLPWMAGLRPREALPRDAVIG